MFPPWTFQICHVSSKVMQQKLKGVSSIPTGRLAKSPRPIVLRSYDSSSCNPESFSFFGQTNFRDEMAAPPPPPGAPPPAGMQERDETLVLALWRLFFLCGRVGSRDAVFLSGARFLPLCCLVLCAAEFWFRSAARSRGPPTRRSGGTMRAQNVIFSCPVVHFRRLPLCAWLARARR